LLNDYFLGIKTGTTPTAGPCLCGYFIYKEFSAIGCLMNSKNTESRWKDMAIMFLWALDKYILASKIGIDNLQTPGLVNSSWVPKK
jgi:D-alanyl-D-alanine carboxypeptidase